MENTEKTIETSSTVSVELSPDQHAFLTGWKKTHEQELGIEVPIGALVRKAVDLAMKSARSKDERPQRSDRPARPDRSMGRSSDRPDFKSGPRKPFGARPSMGRGGPKFNMLGPKNKTRTFNK
ncbi:MAG: hypothetical protein LBK26_02900 [Rickettsiales bacterium]|jgi:hypothetical protein|nr:hypothetical protein [Rickettsiales bacterium]